MTNPYRSEDTVQIAQPFRFCPGCKLSFNDPSMLDVGHEENIVISKDMEEIQVDFYCPNCRKLIELEYFLRRNLSAEKISKESS